MPETSSKLVWWFCSFENEACRCKKEGRMEVAKQVL
jgi:hypothetical protein